MKLLASIKKEWLLLIRDKGGLGILFLMPMILVIVMALVQDAPFRDYQEQQIPVLFVNEDSGTISDAIVVAIHNGKAFHVVDSLDGIPIDSARLSKAINAGEFQIGIVIHKGLGNDRYLVEILLRLKNLRSIRTYRSYSTLLQNTLFEVVLEVPSSNF
jgi:ABC-2 type transport system permease protein